MLRTGCAQWGQRNNNPFTTIDPVCQTNERLLAEGVPRSEARQGGVWVPSRGGDAMAWILCACVASADRAWLGGQRRQRRWNRTERVGLCLNARAHPLRTQCVNALSQRGGRAEERFRPQAAAALRKRRLLGPSLTPLLQAQERPRWAAEGWQNSPKGAEKRVTPGGFPLGVGW
jgi:hypothetical protein